MTTMSIPRKLLIVAAVGAFAACVGPEITSPRPGGRAARDLGELGVSGLLVCKSEVTESSTALITPLGGVVTAGGASVIVPQGALLLPTTITLTVPASKYVEIDVTADGLEHFNFELPVTVVISYERCNRSDINTRPLEAWYIDSQTKALLENMNGIDDKLTKTVTFMTGHLSGYALANRSEEEPAPSDTTIY